ncbi:hypothetical protein [Lacrimispora sp.]|uniref:hypothetical protein n=1 Tax=Lacrimispora sp. TaxID=2719234 RepID=UPI0029E34286|nr:hypothetical protein [Lacrimispora sp.]
MDKKIKISCRVILNETDGNEYTLLEVMGLGCENRCLNKYLIFKSQTLKQTYKQIVPTGLWSAFFMYSARFVMHHERRLITLRKVNGSKRIIGLYK